MRIGVIGAGWLGGTVARAWVDAGHEVMFSSRRPEKFADLSRKLGDKATAGSFVDAARFGEAALLAVRYPALVEIADDTASLLTGKSCSTPPTPFRPTRKN